MAMSIDPVSASPVPLVSVAEVSPPPEKVQLASLPLFVSQLSVIESPGETVDRLAMSTGANGIVVTVTLAVRDVAPDPP